MMYDATITRVRNIDAQREGLPSEIEYDLWVDRQGDAIAGTSLNGLKFHPDREYRVVAAKVGSRAALSIAGDVAEIVYLKDKLATGCDP